MALRLCLSLVLFSSACATVGTHAEPHAALIAPSSRAEPVVVAEPGPGPGCEGMRVALLVNEQATWRRVELTCHADGATLTYASDWGAESELCYQTLELTADQATTLWAELRSVSLASLECGHAEGTRGHRVEVAGAHARRVVECEAAETPAAWIALEAMLTRVRYEGRETDEDVVWPFDAEYWRGELGYARTPAAES